MLIGYFGVILPKRSRWQGYFLDDRFQGAAEAYLDLMRKDEALGPVPKPLTEGSSCPPIAGFIAALAAGIARMSGANADPVSLGVMSQAFAMVTALRYFIIVSEQSGDGEVTQIEDLPNARSADDARGALDRHPLVTRIKREVFDREWERVRNNLFPGPGRT